MDKFEFYNEKEHVIQHNLNPRMRVKVLNFEHRNFQRAGVSTLYDTFEIVNIYGTPYIFLLVEDQFEDEEVEIDLIHSIIRRMGGWYKAKVISNKITPPKAEAFERIFEDENYKIEYDNGFWVATDKNRGLSLKFEENNFDESQKFSFDNEQNISPTEMASVINKLKEWVMLYHLEIM